MALLGQLAVSIIGDTSGYSDGLSKAQRETVKFTKNIERMGRDIATVGYGFQDLGQSLTNKITKPALAAAGVVTGLVGALGFKRLIGMDNAQAKLKGLGVEGKQLEQVMIDVKGAVTGTTHTMAEGADVAAGALAAGVKEGAELERYIKLVGDAATGSNRPMADMAQIFNRVQGSGKLMTMELNQIEHGMPGFSQALAKHLGVAPEKMREMVTEGKVSSDEFLNVMDDFAGGMSEAFAGTWQGITKNILSNIGIIGEALLEGLFEDGKKGMAEFLDFLRNSDGLKQWATETGEKIREFANTVIEKFKEMKQWWDDLSPSVQELMKKIALFGTIGAVAIGPIMLAFGKFIVMIGNVVTRFGVISGAITKLGGLWGILTGPIGITIGVIAGLIAIGVALYKNWDTIKEKAQEVFTKFEPFLDVARNAFQNLFDSVGPIMDNLKGLWESVLPILEKLGLVAMAVIVPAFGIVASVFNAVVSAIGPLLNAVINVVDVIINVFNALIALLMGEFSGAMDFWEKATESTIEFVKNLWEGIVNFFSTLVTSVIEFFKNLYMTLVGNSIIPDMVNAIMDWFNKLLGWLIGTVSKIVKNTVNGFEQMYNLTKNTFKLFGDVTKNTLTYVENTFKNALKFINALVRGDFKSMRDAVNAQMGNIRNLITNIWQAVDNFMGSILGDMWNKVKSRFANMVSSISSATTNIYNTVRTRFNNARDAMIRPIENARDRIKGVVDRIKGFFSNMRLSIPSIKLPKLPRFNLTGNFGLNPPSVPKLSVSWFAKGGLLTNPTIFGAMGNTLLGGGEAGPEAIIPLKRPVLAGIGEAIANTINKNDEALLSATLEQNKILMQLLKKDQDIIVDGETLLKITDGGLSNNFELDSYLRGER